jgi:hypothetical protein
VLEGRRLCGRRSCCSGSAVWVEELSKTTIPWPPKWRNHSPEKPAHFFPPNIVEVKLIVQTQVLATGP